MVGRIGLALVSVVVLAMTCCWPDRGNQSAEEPLAAEERQRTMELGSRIAGTWLATGQIDARPGETVAFIITYHPSGTATATSARMFGGGRAGERRLSSPQHVQWEASGPRRIRWRLLHFGYDSEGTLTYISRTHGVREFDEQFDSSSGSFQVEVFDPPALLDPLSPNNSQAEPIATTEGTDVARRLRVRLDP